MRKAVTIIGLVLVVSGISGLAAAQTTVRVLFDATKAETAGGADWILDADAPCTGRVSHPQQYPTPGQSTITDTDVENVWSGAFSHWGLDLVQRQFTPGAAFHYDVEQLPEDGRITFGDGSNPQDLTNYDIFVLPEANSPLTTIEKDAVTAFVQSGGGLFLVADHAGDDRNNDGWDCPEVLNDLEATMHLGVHFQELGEPNNNRSKDPAQDFVTDWATESPLLVGPFGSADPSRGFAFHGSTTVVLDTVANPTLQAHLYLDSADVGGTSNVLIASGILNSAGRVVIVADTSPFEDGTPTCTDDDDYFDYGDTAYDHRTVFLNATEWLAQAETDVTAPSITSQPTVTAYDCWAVVEWDTDEPTSSRVDYGSTTGYGQVATAPTYSFHHEVLVTGLDPAVTYHFQVSSDDFAGNGPVTSSDDTFTTTVTTPPSITGGPTVEGEADTWVQVTWSSDEPSTAEIEYGPDTSYGSVVTDATLTTQHEVAVTGLTPSSEYHLRVRSVDRCGNPSAWSGDVQVATRRPGLDVSGWTIEDTVGGISFVLPADTVIQAGSYLIVGHDQNRAGFEDEWNTTLDPLVTYLRSTDTGDEFPVIDDTQRRYQLLDASRGLVEGPTPALTTKWKTNQRSGSNADATLVGSWTTLDTLNGNPGSGIDTLNGAGVIISEFSDNYYEGTGGDNGSWRGEFVELHYDDGGVADTTAPVITVEPSVEVFDCTARVTWTTDENATSVVEYGLDDGYGSQSQTAGHVSTHEVWLDGLAAGIEYHYRASSTDASGNGPTVSVDATFTTSTAGDPHLLSGPYVTAATADSFTVTWTTDELTTGVLEYGATTGYGSQETDPMVTTEHTLTVDGLTGASFHYRVIAEDSCSNSTTTADRQVTLPSGGAALDVAGWSVEDTVNTSLDPFVFPAGTTLEPGDMVIIGRDFDQVDFESATQWNVALGDHVHYFKGSTQVNNGFPQINSTNRRYQLLDTSRAIVDGPTPALTTYHNTNERTSPDDDGTLSGSWTTSATESATPGSGVSSGSGAGLVLTEFSDSKPSPSSYESEFIELYYDAVAADPAGKVTMPAPHDFGPQSAGQLSDPVVLQIGNTGDAPLEVSSVALAGESPSEFQLDPLSTPATVPIGGSLDVTVRANPSALGVRHAHLSVSSDDPLNPLATSGLSVTVTSTANDVNGDGSATVDDLLALTGELFDLDGMGVGDVSNDVPVSTPAADADGDGSVSAGDLAVLLGVFSLP